MTLKQKLEEALAELQESWDFTSEELNDIRAKMLTYARDTTLEFTTDLFKR